MRGIGRRRGREREIDSSSCLRRESDARKEENSDVGEGAGRKGVEKGGRGGRAGRGGYDG